ncbi:MAG: HDOD domain-containing protein [Proteobacteria bacterium]|nr:HDOD domain-containing protein [Pseudomonadota bacterium]
MVDKFTVDALVRKVGNIASLPDVYARLDEVIKRPSSSIKDIGKVIGLDPILSARLLRLVNSSFYSLKHQIETVSKAVLLLGTKELRDLSMGTNAVSTFDNIPEELVNMETFWRHSIACGLFARELANMARLVNTERFFVAGLLHDIGKLAIYMGLGDKACKMLQRCRDDHELQYRVETDVLGFNHTNVGLALVKVWNLPEVYKQAISFHHGPWIASQEVAAVHLADVIVNALQLGHSGELLVPSLMPEAWKFLGLKNEIVPSVVRKVQRQISDTTKSVLTKRTF